MQGIEGRGDIVYSENAVDYGLTTGGGYMCHLEGCGNYRIGVRWPDGKITYPCTGGMFVRKDRTRQIGS